MSELSALFTNPAYQAGTAAILISAAFAVWVVALFHIRRTVDQSRLNIESNAMLADLRARQSRPFVLTPAPELQRWAQHELKARLVEDRLRLVDLQDRMAASATRAAQRGPLAITAKPHRELTRTAA